MADLSNIARPYAQAIFALAHEAGELEHWSESLNLLQEIVGNPDMEKVVNDPRITRQQVQDLVLELGGNAFSEPVKNLIRLVAQNRRWNVVPSITRLYEQLRAESEGIVEAELETAFPVSPEQSELVSSALENALGQKIRLNSRVNQDLIGGAVIRAGDWVIDGSIQARLAKLATTLGV